MEFTHFLNTTCTKNAYELSQTYLSFPEISSQTGFILAHIYRSLSHAVATMQQLDNPDTEFTDFAADYLLPTW